MCRTKKIIAGVLCAIVAGIGVIGINAQTADAQTAASQGATATAGMSLEQLQQIIEMLKQQIQQILVLLQKRVAQLPVGGNGVCETAKGENKCNCPADCGGATATCDAKCKADNYESGLCKTWSGVGEVSYGNSYCSNAGETCYCKINSPYSAYPICNKTLSGSPTAEEVAQCAAAKGAIYCGNGWCKCANCGFVNQATAMPPDLGKIVCSYGLNEDQCKTAGGSYVCPENYPITSSYLGTGSTATYYKSACFCSCPAPLDAMPTATSSSAPTGR